MENIYAIECGLFPKNKIIDILKHNNFYFSPDTPKLNDGFGGYISFSEDRVWFMKKVIILNYADFKIAIGNTYREDTNDSAFQIYFPNQAITLGFNYNPEFSKALIAMDDLDMNSASPIIAINLNKKNTNKLINEKDIKLSNAQTNNSRKYKSINLEETKRNGIEKLFLYKKEDVFIVIGWILQGKKNRHTVIYNKAFTEFLMTFQPVDLKTPEGFDLKRRNETDCLAKENTHRQNGNFGSKHNPKFIQEDKTPVLNLEDTGKLCADHTPNIDKINIILEKISRFGLDSLSIKELTFLKNISG